MQTIPLQDVKNHFDEIIDSAQREPVKITRNGRPVAFVVSPTPESIEQLQRDMAMYYFEKLQEEAAQNGLAQEILNEDKTPY